MNDARVEEQHLLLNRPTEYLSKICNRYIHCDDWDLVVQSETIVRLWFLEDCTVRQITSVRAKIDELYSLEFTPMGERVHCADCDGAVASISMQYKVNPQLFMKEEEPCSSPF
jgi:hypothetical protein